MKSTVATATSLFRSMLGLLKLTALLLLVTASPRPADAADPTDISSYVSVSYTTVSTSYNPFTKVYTASHTATLRNASDRTFPAPLHGVLVFRNLVGTVTVPGALGGFGAAPYQNYYYDLGSQLPSGSFAPGATASVTVVVKFKAGTTLSSTAITPYGVVAEGSVNIPPTANAGQPQSVTLQPGQTTTEITLSGSGSDSDGTIAAYLWSGTPDPADLQSPTVTLPVGTHSFTLVVTDNLGAQSAPSQVTVTVNPAPNLPPTANAGQPQSVTLQPGQTTTEITLSGSGSDSDGTIAGYAWSGTPDPADVPSPTVTLPAGTYSFTLVVTDNLGAQSAPSQVTVTVNRPVNSPPVLAPIGARSVAEGALLSFTVSGSDPDNDTLQFSTGALPAGAFFDTDTRSFSFRPGYDQAGGHQVVFSLSDGTVTVAETVTVTVANTNRPPVLSPVESRSVAENSPLTFTLAGSDPDGDTLSFSAAPLPSGAALDPLSGAFSWTPGYSQAGSYHVTYTASDGTDSHSRSAELTVTEVNRAPAITTLVLPAPRIDRPYGAAVAATDPDGDTLAFSLSGAPAGMTIDQASGSLLWTPAVSDMGESFTFRVTVEDGRGGSDSRDYSITIADSIAPAVLLNAPREVVPGASFAVTAVASDNVAVTSLVFDSGTATCSAVDNCRLAVTAGQSTPPGSTITVGAEARDAAGNVGAATAEIRIASAPDTVPPAVSLSAPSSVTPGQRITLSATATDNQGVAGLTFADKDGAIGSVAPPAASVSYTIPADAAVGSRIPFMVTATDFSNLTAAATAESLVVQGADDSPPVIVLSAPESVVAGRSFAVNLKVSDDRGVANVDLLMAHRKVSTFANPVDESVTLAVPADTEAGTRLAIEVTALDSAGNSSSSLATTTVQVLQGLVTGAVYHDGTGAPVQGAEARLSIAGRDDLTATTDHRGHYSFVTEEGTGLVTVTMPGYTRVDRPGTAVVVNAGRRVHDARLTPIPAATATLPSILGGAVSAPFTASGSGITSSLPSPAPAVAKAASLAVPGGSLAGDLGVTLTQVGAQGLQGLLPAGWSPAAAFQVGPAAASFAAPAAASLPNLLSLPAGASYPLVKWDEGRGVWSVTGAATVDSGGTTIQCEVSSAGQYAVALADAGSNAAAPAAGEVLPAAAAVAIPQEASALVLPQPKLILYQPGVKSEVGTRLAATGGLPSGTLFWADIAEEYHFYTGERMAGEPFQQDIVLYSFGREGVPLAADYFVSPTLDFAGLALQSGTITVTASVPPVDGDTVTVVGAAGGSFSTPGGESVAIPAGAVARFVPLNLAALTLSDSGITLPAGVDFVGGLYLGLGGMELKLPATLSVPLQAGFTPAGDLMLVRAVEVNGQTRLVFVAAAVVENGKAVSRTDLLGNGTLKGTGPLVEGRYLLLDSRVRAGYAGGAVTGIDRLPFPGALVTSDLLPLGALSGPGGGYLLPVTAGPFNLTALDPVRRDRGLGAGTGTAGAFTSVDLDLRIEPPQVVSTAPASSGVGAALADPVKITFSEPIDPASVKQANFTLAAATGPVPCTLELSSANSVVTMRHAEPFTPATVYTLTVQGVADLAGYLMAAPFSASFTSLDTNPPPAPPAANLAATIPGEENSTTVTGTQGSAGLHDTVYVVNLTTGARNQVQVNPDGGFSATIAATLKDRLQLEITSPAGVSTTVGLPKFRQVNQDGSILEVAGPEGGWIEGPGGTSVGVPQGAFPDGAVITMKALDEEAFPVKLSEEDKKRFRYSGGIDLDFGGKTPLKYLNVSVPAQPDDGVKDRWVLVQAVEVNGKTAMASVDTARIIDGRVTTSSPPCPGVTARGGYAFIKSFLPMGVVYGNIGPSAAGYSADITSNDVMMAYGINLNGTYAFCAPVFSTDISVTYNTVELELDSTALRPPVHEVTVTNNTGDTKSRFAAKDLFYGFEIAGGTGDSYRMVVKDTLGVETPVTSFLVEPAQSGYVRLKVNVNDLALTNPGDEVTVQNLTSAPVAPVTTQAADLKMKVKVDGGVSDSFEAVKVDPASAGTTLVFGAIASPYGSQNMIFRVTPGMLVPVRPGGARLSAMHLIDSSAGTTFSIPLTSIVDNGVVYNFDGKLDHNYAFRVMYDDGTEADQVIGKFTIKLRDAQGAVAKEITLPSPFTDMKTPIGTLFDIPGTPLMLPFPPEQLYQFDPGKNQLTFTFTEPVDSNTVLTSGGIVIRDGSGTALTGEFRIHGENGNMVTFIPAAPLKLGSTYTINVSGVKDLGGELVVQSPLTLTTVSPSLVKRIDLASPTIVRITTPPPGPYDIPLGDIAITSGTDASGAPVTSVVAVTDTVPDEYAYRYATFSIPSDPMAAAKVGDGFGGGGKKRVQVLKGIDLAVRGDVPGCSDNITGDDVNGYRFKGDLAVASSSISGWMTTASFFDVTDPAATCQLGGKLLTADPSHITDYTRPGTFHTTGDARGVAVLSSPAGYTALIGVGGFGVLSVDIGKNIPDFYPAERQREGLFSGDFPDVIAERDNIFLLNKGSYPPQLEIYDPNFIKAGVLPLPQYTSHIGYAGPVKFDANRDGALENYDLLFSWGLNLQSVLIVDVRDRRQPKVLGNIKFEKPIRTLDFDRDSMKLVAASRDTLYLADLSGFNAVDVDGDGKDDRVVWSSTYSGRLINCIRTEGGRGLFYVGTTNSLDVYRLAAKNLTGHAKYVRFKMKQPGGTDPGGLDFDPANISKPPMRGVLIEVQDKVTKKVYDRTATNEEGFFSLNAPLNQDLLIVAKAAVGDPAKPLEPHLRVIKPPADNTAITAAEATAYYEATEDARCTAAPCNKDLLAKQEWVWNAVPVRQVQPCDAACKTRHYGVGSFTVRDASPFALLDTIYGLEDKFRRQVDPKLTFFDLTMIWGPNVSNNTWARSETKVVSINGHLSDTDEYDHIILGHEWMHVFQHYVMREDTMGGSHSSGERSDPLLAYNEGVCTSHSLLLNGEAIYFDTGKNGRFYPGYTVDDYDAGVANKGFYDENAITEMIYKLVKDVKVPLSEIYDADVKQKKAVPYVTLFSFLHDLADRHFAAGSSTRATFGNKIDALLRTKNVVFEQTDRYEPAPAKLYNSISLDHSNTLIYTTFSNEIGNNTPGDNWFVGKKFTAADTLATYGGNDGAKALNGNKLMERLYFKIHVDPAQAGTYEFRVAPSMCLTPPGGTPGTWVAAINSLRDKDTVHTKNVKWGTVTLGAGEYVMSVSTYIDVGPDTTSPPDRLFSYAPCNVKLTITPK